MFCVTRKLHIKCLQNLWCLNNFGCRGILRDTDTLFENNYFKAALLMLLKMKQHQGITKGF